MVKNIKKSKRKTSPRNSNENEDNTVISDISTDSTQNVYCDEITTLNSISTTRHYIKYTCVFIFNSFKLIIKISGVYLLWIILHFGASHLYIKFCVPSTILGFIISPFMTASPHCQGLRWIIYNGANTINNMWVILGTWICTYLIQMNGTNDDRTQI
jgi:hypothetical protein